MPGNWGYKWLDNLKLGYGGTQEEMKRLLKDAEKLTGKKYELSSYADIVEAIHAVQESMGIAGTTAAEADETISGSLSSLKAAWGNALTSLVVGGDSFDRCIDNLVDSAKTFGKNIMPAIVKALTGVGSLIEELAPIIAKEFPTMIRELLPPLIKGATALVKGLIIALPDIIKTIAAEIPTILAEVWEGFREAFGDIPGFDAVEGFFGKLGKIISGNADKIKKFVPIAFGIVAAFKLLGKIKSLTSIFGGKGGKGGGMLGGLGGLAKMKPQVILKGMANIALILGGLAALAALIMWVSPYIAKLSDMQSVGEVLLVIGAVGLIGSLLARLAGAVGVIPIGVVLTGLGSIALAIAAVTGIVAAFGALSQIDGYTEFMASGGDALVQIFGIIGECAGAVVGGFAEGVTASLPEIGSNLAAFGENVAPLFTTFSGVDMGGFNDFLGAFSQFVLVMTGEKILGMITGGVDYASLGTQLSNFAANAGGFFTVVADIPEQAFTNTTALFNALANVSNLPKEGGVLGWFAGEQTAALGTLTAQLPLLGASVSLFFAALGGATDFTAISDLFTALGGVAGLPSEGGVLGWFAGEQTAALTTLTSQLPSLGAGVAAFFTSIGGVTDFTPISDLFTALAGISAMPAEGGIMGWFGGDQSTGLTNVASQLPGVATHIAAFFANLGGITDFTPISNLFNSLGSIDVDASAADKGIFGWGTSEFEALGTGLSNFATNASGFFNAVNTFDADKLTGFFTTVGGASGLPTALAGIDGELGTVLSTMAATIQTGMMTARIIITVSLTAMVSAITGRYSAFLAAGGMIMDGLNAGMKAKKAVLVATAASMASAIQRAFNVSLDIHSPSRVMMKSGGNVVGGVVKGMRAEFPDVRDTARDMGYITRRAYDGYAPSASTVSTYNSYGGSSTSIAPVFNLSISGSQDDRVLARKVKGYVSEAIRDTFDSLDRKMGDVREA